MVTDEAHHLAWYQRTLEPYIDAVTAQAGIRTVDINFDDQHTRRVILGIGSDQEVIVLESEDMRPGEELFQVIAWNRRRGNNWLITMTSHEVCGRDVPAAEIGQIILDVLAKAGTDPLPARVSHELTGTPWFTRAFLSLLPRKVTG
ncbi:hypothetical protein [Nonomuraea sp. NPDC023979]|uniref:hypothetical protein n=1 Tax=Nonomuraea sp. NPDC023979 TaxID=3154796 RepID=UPI0033C99C92